MKLNLRPNYCELAKSRGSPIHVDIVLYFSLLYNLFIHIFLVTCSDPLLSPTNHHHNQEQQQQQQQQQANKYRTSQSSYTTLPGKDVTNLHLIPDFRAVKLRWSYEHSDKNQPASFDVRFCELTSWNIEIKCRHRDMMVEREPTTNQLRISHSHQKGEGGVLLPQQETKNSGSNVENSVIMRPSIDTVHQMREPTPDGPKYEAQIFDLRALTNYTFQVQVSRFEHEPKQLLNVMDGSSSNRANRAQSARRLSQESSGEQHLVRRIETKPFGAEATKCLADVSEVLINTGRYFGGRISVEDSNDPRCHLIGNKSSEQSTYLFRIDHDICASKIVDGKRIETMVLVHENKDILTHNTARFLVLCNFLQKSFTLRASVSLPRVNALLAPSRPAVITSLPRYEAGGDELALAGDSPKATSVMLGSMPGVYRARVPHANTDNASNQTLKRATTTAAEAAAAAEFEDANHATSYKPAVNSRQPLDELETNTIERKFLEKDSLQPLLAAAEGQAVPMAASASAATPIQSRQSKELGFSGSASTSATASNPTTAQASRQDSNGIDSSRARSMMLLEPNQVNSLFQESNKFLAQPVRVQSKVLYIERADASPADAGRLIHQQHLHRQQQHQQEQDLYNKLGQHTTTNSVEHSSQIDTPASRMPTTSTLASMASIQPSYILPSSPATDMNYHSRHSKQLAELTSDQLADDSQAPIIITNNHRVSGNYLPVAQAAAAASFRVSKWLNSPDNSNNNNGDSGGISDGNNFTIKYSADRVDDFAVGNQDDYPVVVDPTRKSVNPNLIMRARSGRMRSIVGDLVAGRQAQHPVAMLTARTITTTTATPGVDTSDTDMDLSKQPAWSVNRMGESFGGSADGADLMAETSNETTSHAMVANSSSLAQNITGAILRWSLKALTNLARKSLETLMNDTTSTNSSTSGPFEEPNSINQAISQQSSFEKLDSSANRWNRSTPPPEPPAKRSTQTSIPASTHLYYQPPHVTTPMTTTTAATTAATTKLSGSRTIPPKTNENQQAPGETKLTTTNPSNELRPFEERLADGFITSGRQSDGPHSMSIRQPLTSTTTHHLRPSNYSKSLDLSRSGDSIRHRNTSERNAGSLHTNKPAVNQSNSSGNNNNKHRTLTNNSPIFNENNHSNDSLWSNRASSYSSWLLYGILLFVALVTAIFLIICLVPTRPNRSHSRSALDSSEAEARSIRPLGFKRESALPALVFGGSVGDHSCQSGGSIHDSTYQRYDYNKFENYSSNSINNKMNLQQQQADNKTDTSRFSQRSPSEVSHSTRSTSANSASMADENDCKNNEFLYTEHVLINTGASFGESYA